jgi:hypothetical protein
MVIKALEVTLAPFAQPEKPQLFPRPATSFIKRGQSIGLLRTAGADCRFERPQVFEVWLRLFLLAFCDALWCSAHEGRSPELVPATR